MRPNCVRTPSDGGRPLAADVDHWVGKLVEAVEPSEIVLFGSGATHRLGPRSDLDFLLLVERDTRGAEKRARRALGRRRAIDTAAEPWEDGNWAAAAIDAGDWRSGAAASGVTLYRDGRLISYTETGLRPGPFPERDLKPTSREAADTAYDLRRYADDCLRDAQWHAGHINGPTSRHRAAALCRRAASSALQAAVLGNRVGDCRKRTIPEAAEKVRSGGIRLRAGAAELAELDRWRKWGFRGENLPTPKQSYAAIVTAASIVADA